MRRYLLWSFYAALVGLLAGLSSTVFLWLLKLVTDAREANPVLLCFLPLAGFVIGWGYHRWGGRAARGNNLILDEIHDPTRILPLRMAPLVLAGTVLTHLFGGSAGREGTAVQMGASLADQLSQIFRVSRDERRILLVAGAGAGFGAAIGAPWAGMFFGMEVIYVGRLRVFALPECFIAAFVGYFTARWLHAPHSVYPLIAPFPFSFSRLAIVISFGAICGLVARVFVHITHAIERAFAAKVAYPPLRPFIGGTLLALVYVIGRADRYAGLGLDVIQAAFRAPLGWKDPAAKLLLTALTIGSGFKGGEFIPLVFIGTTLGNVLAASLGALVFIPILAGLGFAAVFAGAANTPVACTLMAGELFGWAIAPWAFVACVASYLASGPVGIYRGQRSFPREKSTKR